MLSTGTLFLLGVHGAVLSECQRGETCWPTQEEVQDLFNSLNPEMNRTFGTWQPGDTRITAVPFIAGEGGQNVNEQPLYGLAQNQMDPVYYFDAEEPEACFTQTLVGGEETRDVCYAATRNMPTHGQDPGFVVFALTTDHVVKAVRFAVDHGLCIAVFGTGHDFINRHSCTGGVYVRTTFMKGMEFDVNDSNGYGWSQGNVKVGPGVIFHELHEAASQQGKFMSSGHATTVGVAGWSMGGGHGPTANMAGNGADNILEVELVTGEGAVLRVNKDENADLWKAIRGGGGSWVGIVTEFVLRTHDIPSGGFTKVIKLFSGTGCHLDSLRTVWERYGAWALSVDKRWSGLVHAQNQDASVYDSLLPFLPNGTDTETCGSIWGFIIEYTFAGPLADGLEKGLELQALDAGLEGLLPGLTGIALGMPEWIVAEYATIWDAVKDRPLEAIQGVTGGETKGIPSIVVQHETVESGAWLDHIMSIMSNPDPSSKQEIYHGITGAPDADRPTDVSISSGLRNGLFHHVFGARDLSREQIQTYYDLEPHSYFSESEFAVADWKTRYWDDYDAMVAVKRKYDPTNAFGCNYCIGYDDGTGTVGNGPEDKKGGLSSTAIALICVGSILAFALLALLGYHKFKKASKEPEPLSEAQQPLSPKEQVKNVV